MERLREKRDNLPPAAPQVKIGQELPLHAIIVAVTERDSKLLLFIQEHANYEGAGPLFSFLCLHEECRLLALTKNVERGRSQYYLMVIILWSSKNQKCLKTKSDPKPKVPQNQKCPKTKSAPKPKVPQNQKCPKTKSAPK